MRLTLSRLGGALLSLPILFACASGGASGRDANVITAPELGRSRAANAYDAIRRVRPDLLRNRGSGTVTFFSARRPAVAVDDSLAGGVEVLRAIPIDEVARIEYVGAWQAANKYGLELKDGIVLVTKRAGSEPKLAGK